MLNYIIEYRIYNRVGRYYTRANDKKEAVDIFLRDLFWKTKEDIISIYEH